MCGAAGEGGNGQQACDRPTPRQSTQTFIKRIVAGPGDRVSIRGGHVYRNGVREKDAYIAPCGDAEGCNFPKTIVIPPGDYFMMGDNRGESDDSRFWGPVPKKWIIGVAFFTYWPPDRSDSSEKARGCGRQRLSAREARSELHARQGRHRLGDRQAGQALRPQRAPLVCVRPRARHAVCSRS